MRRRRVEPRPDDGLIGFRQNTRVPAEIVEMNSRLIMADFDELPRQLRNLINYAETPEEGAQPVRECLSVAFDADTADYLLTKKRR